jgi:5-methylcytosine-specific restriction endonuclease McrA
MNKEDGIGKQREVNDEKITEHRNKNIDWDHFKYLVWGWHKIDHDMDRKKVPLQPKDRLKFEIRDKGLCYICGSTFHYGSCNVYLYTQTTYKLSHLHHVIPNGGVDEENIVTLCTHCHQMVHQAMYVAGTWKYGRPI